MDIVRILWIYPHFVDNICIGHIKIYLDRNVRPILHIYSSSASDWWTDNLHVNMSDSSTMVMLEKETMMHVLEVAMIQTFSLKKGLKKFGTWGEKAVTKESNQLHDMQEYFTLYPKNLTKDQLSEVLWSLMFLVEKHNGGIKARVCADGGKYSIREGYKKEYETSTTLSTEGLIITCAIGDHADQELEWVDIPIAYIYTLTDEEVIMLLKVTFKELMVMVYPLVYRKYVIYNIKEVPILYVNMNKVLYVILKRSLLLYKKLRGELESSGFEINSYDPCVANKRINNTQMKTICHVDDIKVSHKDDFDINKFGLWLEGI